MDAIYGGGPATLERLAHSPFVEQGTPDGDSRKTRFSDMTIYTADSGALVFATGSIQWSWGLDGYNAPGWHTLRVSEAAQQMTRNVLARMLRGLAVPQRPEHRWAEHDCRHRRTRRGSLRPAGMADQARPGAAIMQPAEMQWPGNGFSGSLRSRHACV